MAQSIVETLNTCYLETNGFMIGVFPAYSGGPFPSKTYNVKETKFFISQLYVSWYEPPSQDKGSAALNVFYGLYKGSNPSLLKLQMSRIRAFATRSITEDDLSKFRQYNFSPILTAPGTSFILNKNDKNLTIAGHILSQYWSYKASIDPDPTNPEVDPVGLVLTEDVYLFFHTSLLPLRFFVTLHGYFYMFS